MFSIPLPQTAIQNLDGDSSTVSTKKCQLLETVVGVCDGRSIATEGGAVALENVTAVQSVTGTTYSDLTGSSVTYLPPKGTTQVEYTFSFHLSKESDYTLMHAMFMLDGVEVELFRRSYGVSVSIYGLTAQFHAVLHVDESLPADDVANGKLKSWDAAKNMHLQVRNYDTKRIDVHDLLYWDGADVNGTVTKPTIKICSIGTA